MKEMLSLGSSRPWREAMEKMTGQRKMSTKAIREYFQPLEAWLKGENKRTGVTVGWGETDVDSMCQQTVTSSVRERPGETEIKTTFDLNIPWQTSFLFSGRNLANGSLTLTAGGLTQVVLLIQLLLVGQVPHLTHKQVGL